MGTTTSSIKNEARRIIDQLPKRILGRPSLIKLYLRHSIEAGLKDADEGRVESLKRCTPLPLPE
jgi:hypothetical protein